MRRRRCEGAGGGHLDRMEEKSVTVVVGAALSMERRDGQSGVEVEHSDIAIYKLRELHRV